ncbi:MAG TPA: SPW repeat protein [Chloroflexia bacterium]|nr:SPW repeat protein [Chloroflexia bacterium]
MSVNFNRTGNTTATDTWPGWLGVIGGIWLIIAPFILGYSNNSTPLYNDIIFGIIGIVLTGFCALTAGQPNTAQARRIAGWLSVLEGVWLIIAPFVLGYNNIGAALWNDIITGVLFVIIGAYATTTVAGHLTGNI